MRGADHQAAEDADQVHAADPALELGRDRPLPDRDRGGAPDERVRAEDEEDHHRDPRRRWSSARARWVRVSMISPIRMRLPRLTRAGRSSRSDTVPTSPPTARHRGQQAEADVAQPEPLGGVEHEHRPGGAEGDVEDEDREHQRAHRGVVPAPSGTPSTMSCQTWSGSRPGRGRAAAARCARPAPRRARRRTACATNGSAMPDGEQRRRRSAAPTSWLTVMKPVCSRALAIARSSRCDEHRQQRLGGVVGEHLGGAEQEHRDEHQRDRRRRR